LLCDGIKGTKPQGISGKIGFGVEKLQIREIFEQFLSI
jgi:hypothetical protein